MLRVSRLGFLLLMVVGYGPVHSAPPSCQGPAGGEVGQCAPNLTLQEVDGTQVKLSSFRGKVVFLNFWASWCEPCRVELPSMERAYQSLQGQDVVMLAVSIDAEGKEMVDKFFGSKKPPYALFLDPKQQAAHRIGTFKVPETYIIDKSGRVRDKIQGAREWEDSITLNYLKLLASL